MTNKKVLIVGGGAAGLAAAVQLADCNIPVDLVEKSSSLGGHGLQFSCKAVETCVKCGACMVDEKLRAVQDHPLITVHLQTTVDSIRKTDGLSVDLLKKPSGSDSKETGFQLTPDAIIIATGFIPYDPTPKPYGYGLFSNVITNLDLEKMLRYQAAVNRPSDGNVPKKIAFLQCVGSRDAKLNHLWCSRICCASALRMARRILNQSLETEITFFYIDVQNFGKDFEKFYQTVKSEIRMIRSIPADIFNTENDALTLSYLAPESRQMIDENFDLVVLSVGLTPNPEARTIAGFPTEEPQFIQDAQLTEGMFTAGTVRGPMGIADSMADAGNTAAGVLAYLNLLDPARQ